MNQLVIVGAVALVIGVAGGTMMSPARKPVPVDSTALAAHEPAAAEVHQPAAAPVVAAVDTTPTAAHSVVPDAAGGDSAVNNSTLVQSLEKLPPAESAPLLASFTDVEVLAALRQLTITRASQIIAAMPSERGTRMSRQLLMAGAQP